MPANKLYDLRHKTRRLVMDPPTNYRGAALRYNLKLPSVKDYKTIFGTVETGTGNVIDLSGSIDYSHEGNAITIAAADSATAQTAGIWRPADDYFTNVGDSVAFISEFGWRRVNFNGNTNSSDCYVCFGLSGRRHSGNSRYYGVCGRYEAASEDGVQLNGANCATNLSIFVGAGGSIPRQAGIITAILICDKISTTEIKISRWVCDQHSEPWYIDQVTLTPIQSPWLGYLMHVNNNGHDVQMIIYGERTLTRKELATKYGITQP